jgi:hypothetical protein
MALSPDAPMTGVTVVKVEAEPTDQEKAQVRQWQDTLTREDELHKDLFKRMRKWRRAAKGESDHDVHVNLHQASLETLLPLLYAQDPEVQVKPSESIDPARYGSLQPFASTLRIVIDRQLYDADLKSMVERVIRSAKVCGYGVVKVIFQTDTAQDPQIVAKINDVQDNLKRVAELTQDIAEGYCDDEDADKQTLEDTLSALQAKVEVLKSMGIVLDFVPADDFIVPHSVAELIDYVRSPWLGQRIWMDKDDAVAQFGLSEDECQKLTTYPCRDGRDEDASSVAHDAKGMGKAGKEKKGELVCVREVWDNRAQVVRTLIDGLDRYAKPTFAPQFVGKRWYPYFVLAFSWAEGEREPLSAVAMADLLVQEYNATRSGFKEHREGAKPATLFDKGLLSVEDVQAIQNRRRLENIGIDAQGQPVGNLVTTLQNPPIDPALYTTDPIRAEIDMIYGVQDAMRGVVMKAKTATEAEIMQQGMGARTLGQRSALEKWLGEIAQYVAEVLLLAMPEQQVAQIVGEGYQWPKLSRDQVFNLVQVDIRAGSTGQPDKQKDQQTWTQLLPELTPMLEKYGQAMAQGMTGAAESIKNLIAETLRRFDDRIDVETILPKVEPQPPPPPPDRPPAEQALMGPQIQALQAIVTAVRGGLLPPDAGAALVQASFPHITPDLIAGMLGTPAMHAANDPSVTPPHGGGPAPDLPGLAAVLQGGQTPPSDPQEAALNPPLPPFAA